MFTTKIVVFVAIFLGSMLSSTAQTEGEKMLIAQSYDQDKINSLEDYLIQRRKMNTSRFNLLQAIHGWPETVTAKNGTTSYLIGVNLLEEPLYVSTMNDQAAQMQGARELQTGGSFGLNMEGQGMTVGVWDIGKIRESHQALVGRTVAGEALTTLNGHSTHVAGTIASNGTGDMSARGIAPQSIIEYYKFQSSPTEVEDEMEMSRAASTGLLVSNHSYGIASTQVAVSFLGKYDDRAQSWDQVSNTYPYYLIVCAAGNSRINGVNPSDNGYDLLTSTSNAKNNLVIGASFGVANYTGPASVGMSTFSNWGPTDDGRVKPDITTKGVSTYSTDDSGDNQFIFRTGTSMSSPAVAGGAILLQQYYNSINGNYIKAATLKGLILHTASEAGTANGPDYEFGWGLMNTKGAADVIQLNQSSSLISELSLQQGMSFTKSVTANGNALFSNKLIVSISWNDPATATADFPSMNQEDDRTAMIVNDLDISVTDQNGTVVYRPWKLNPVTPGAAATTGINNVDNFEKIEIDQPVGNYTISVNHKANLLHGVQDFSLIISGADDMTLSSQSEELESVTLYPNPTDDRFTVVSSKDWSEKLVSIVVYDILGKQVLRGTYENTGRFEKTIDVSNLNSGMYLVRVENGSIFSTRKLIVR
jgi:serine protease AprX